MCEALDDHDGRVSIGERLITNFRFADDIVVNAEDEEEARVLVNVSIQPPQVAKWRLVQTDESDDKQLKWLLRGIKIKGQRPEARSSGELKYPRAIISNEGSKPEILSRIAQTAAALSTLKIIWRDHNISLASKVKLMRTLILYIFLYAYESWTLTAELERRIQALEMRCYMRRDF